MSSNTVRIMLSLGLVVVMVPAYLLLFYIISPLFFRSDETALLAASAIVVPSFTLLWICVWARSVKWNIRTVRRTGIAVAVSFVSGAAVASIYLLIVESRPWQVPTLFAVLVYGGVWIAASAVAWAEPHRTGVGGPRVICPKCSYDMRGLDQPRCPECGTRYTLDELLAANTPRPE